MKKGQSNRLRTGRVSTDYGAYSITKVVNNRRPVLTNDAVAKELLDSWNYLRSHHQIKLFAFCLMPDHYHLAFCLLPGHDLSDVMGATNKFTAGKINKLLGLRGTFWQEGFRDRQCRDREELHDNCVYIEHNPVRAGLVEHAEKWPYSSASPARKGLLDRDWWP